MIEDLEKFKKALQLDRDLAEQIKEIIMQNIIALAKTKGYNVSESDIEEDIRIKNKASMRDETSV